MFVKPKTNFARMKEGELNTLAGKVLKDMSDNPDFLNPSPPLATLADDLAGYREALVDSAFGGRLTTELKRQKRKKLEDTMDLMAIYVRTIARGDPAVILSSGFNHTKPKGATVPCPKPGTPRTIHGPVGSGRLTVRVKSHLLARSYLFLYRLKGEEEWITIYSNKSFVTFDSLEKFKVYEFRVAYVGTHPSIIYSDIIEAYAA